MRRGWYFGVLLVCWAVGSARAQHAGHGDPSIKALSGEQVDDLRNGRGMGLALAAERNQYPGPSHVLELGEKLALTSAQRTQVQARFDQMHAAAVALGAQLIAEEAALDQLFAHRTATDDSLAAATAAIGATQARLRAVHLGAHLRMVAILTPAQIRHYAALRGHADPAPTRPPPHHRPVTTQRYGPYVGRTETRADTVDPVVIRGLAATLDIDPAAVAPGGVLPPLWHWMLFQDWVSARGLGIDGHPQRGGFLPPVHDLPRRMWAGGRVRFIAPLHAGEAISRTSTILSVEEKSGGSGRLVFVTVQHAIAGPNGPAIEEEHDIVYRGAEGAAVKAAEPAPPPPEDAFTATVHPNPVLLFRYSALTANGHRIHYDLDYVTREEGYPGLVVHGPLQATWMADIVRQYRPGARILTFAYRGRRPAFHQNPLSLVGYAAGEKLRLETRDHEGAICMSAEATLA